MTNVSKHALSPNKQEQLFDELSKILSTLSSSNTRLFLGELLGKEEQIMLAKRFAAIALLERNYSPYRTATTLHLSTATVTKLNTRRQLGHYKNITHWLKNDRGQAKRFLELLDSTLTLGGLLPHYGHQSRLIKKSSSKKLSVN